MTAIACPREGCGLTFHVDDAFEAQRRIDGLTFHCPNGHRLSYKDNELARLRKQVQRLRDEITWWSGHAKDLESQRDAWRRSSRANRGVITKMRRAREAVEAQGGAS